MLLQGWCWDVKRGGSIVARNQKIFIVYWGGWVSLKLIFEVLSKVWYEIYDSKMYELREIEKGGIKFPTISKIKGIPKYDMSFTEANS